VYGVDLAGLDPGAIRMGNILGMCEITIPRPTRIATEVDGSHPVEEVVEVTGARFRAQAGEYYLGLARKEIYEQARKNSLPPEKIEEINTQTREQVEALGKMFPDHPMLPQVICLNIEDNYHFNDPALIAILQERTKPYFDKLRSANS
jgi:hypothetical protein